MYETVENEIVEYETMVCNKMPMFPVKMVSLLHSSNTDMVMNEFPAVVENKLMLPLFAVNTDFTGMETKPDALVDMFLLVQSCMARGHSLGQPRRYYQVRIYNRFSTLKISILGILFPPGKMFTHLP